MTVTFGIDLGTTNSTIAKYANGTVEVFKNPIGQKETLPSVVAFRSGRVLVGEKAREYLEKDPRNVVGAFKRKMGTSETFWIDSLSETRSPVELSALVLRELKTFVYTGEPVEAAVITIPTSFDTVQSNATKRAGEEAGFAAVFLLQEPIAASLAYANKDDQADFDGQQWLVYDLGGGTFDVALVRAEGSEMRIVDHEGDNFLGGVDFDNLIIEQLVVPHLQTLADFGDLNRELRSASGRYNALYYVLMKRAEELKVQLSSAPEADIEFAIETPDGQLLDVFLTISRVQFEQIIRPKLDETIRMIERILDRNDLRAPDLSCVLLVGGSTYTPLVRQLVGQQLGIPVSTAVDPTTAVAVGAAYFAGSKKWTPVALASGEKTGLVADPAVRKLTVRTAYHNVSRDTQEFFLAQVAGDTVGLLYRLTRADGGFDTGLRPLGDRISETLPLVHNAENQFVLSLLDAQHTVVYQQTDISIVTGKYGILGQPLPNDICLEVDDLEKNRTRLEVVFEKNAILPLRKTLTRELSKTIKKGSDDRVIINVLEGSRTASALTNRSIGIIEIVAKDLTMDIIKGSDVEITLELSESRDLRITTYLMMTDQAFTNLFVPTDRQVSVAKLRDELAHIMDQTQLELRQADEHEEYELASQLRDLHQRAGDLLQQTKRLADDDVTDSRYQLEDRKQQVAAQLEMLTQDRNLQRVKEAYFKDRNYCRRLVDEHGTEAEKNQLAALTASEKTTLATNSIPIIEAENDKLWKLIGAVRWRVPEELVWLYHYYSSQYGAYSNQERADELIKRGEKALDRQNYNELRVIIDGLYALLPPDDVRRTQAPIRGTGLS